MHDSRRQTGTFRSRAPSWSWKIGKDGFVLVFRLILLSKQKNSFIFQWDSTEIPTHSGLCSFGDTVKQWCKFGSVLDIWGWKQHWSYWLFFMFQCIKKSQFAGWAGYKRNVKSVKQRREVFTGGLVSNISFSRRSFHCWRWCCIKKVHIWERKSCFFTSFSSSSAFLSETAWNRNKQLNITFLMFPLLQPPWRTARTAPAGTASAASCLGPSRQRCRPPPPPPPAPPSRPPSMESASLRETCCFRWTSSFSDCVEECEPLHHLCPATFRPWTVSCWWWQPRATFSTHPRPSRTSSASTR